jgi:thymidylate synthase (FAD)
MTMKVKLLSYSQPTAEVKDDLGTVQDLIAYAARVSNPSNQMNTKTTDKLLTYLANHKHWSPFEMASACFEVTTTRDIARQMLRHRSFTFQEFSQRYADPTKDLDFVLRDARLQDPKNRQNSVELDMSDDYEGGLQDRWLQMQQRVIDESVMAYTWAVDNGIAKEQARAVLPEGNTVSRLYVNGTIRSWIHYVELRSGNGTQLEHIELARAIGEAITEIFPLAEQYINN